MLKQGNGLSKIGDVLTRNFRARVADDEDEAKPVLDTREKPIVRIINGTLDEDQSSPNAIVLQGRIDPQTLRFLKVDQSYQRPLAERPEIFEAIKAGVVVPNIEVGVRGQDFKADTDGTYTINSPAYIIDGWQRVGNALRVLELVPNQSIRIFATVHFGTDDIWERHRFTELNTNTKRVSSSLHLRNLRDTNEAVLTLYGLSNNVREFPLYKKMAWGQNMKRGELIQAQTVTRAVLRLHRHVRPANEGGSIRRAADKLQDLAQKVGLQNFRKNVVTFFELVDEAWSIRAIEYRSPATQIKASFLNALASVFSAHGEFWDASGKVLFVAAPLRRKLSQFPVNDPHIRNLASSGGASTRMLFDLMVRHINSGRRTGQLRSRYEK